MELGNYYDMVMEKAAEKKDHGTAGAALGAGTGAGLALGANNLVVRHALGSGGALSKAMFSHPRLAQTILHATPIAAAAGGAALGHRLLSKKKD